MGSLEELVYEAEERERAEWEASPEGRAALAEAERERGKELAARARLEGVWAAKHPAEWAEWEWVKPQLAWTFDFGAGKEFDFDDFLKEVGRRPSPAHRVASREDDRPFQQGNLVWVAPDLPRIQSPYLTLSEAAAYCRRAPKTLSNHLSQGNLRTLPGTRPPLFRKEELDAWLTAPGNRRRK